MTFIISGAANITDNFKVPLNLDFIITLNKMCVFRKVYIFWLLKFSSDSVPVWFVGNSCGMVCSVKA